MTSILPPYPTPDTELGETLYPDEAVLAARIAETIETGIRSNYQPGTARRDAHPKAHGLVEAEFRVNDDIPERFAKGVFIPGKTYKAWLRFSNGDGDPTRSDDNEDGRGLAIKLFDVPGEKILDGDRVARTQDFVMIDHPQFFISDPKRYLELVQKAGSGSALAKASIPFAIGPRSLKLFKKLNSGKIANPLEVRYFSATAYQLGVGQDRFAIKFSVTPASEEVSPLPAERGPDYLREAMRASLLNNEVELRFLVQPRTSEAQSVEDSMTIWEEAETPFHEVARIRIPAQEFATPERDKLGEDLSFDPWHSLPDHKPLGVTNRLRRQIYFRIREVRYEMNGVTASESDL